MSLRGDLIEAGAEAYASVIIASRDDEDVTAYELRQKAMTAAFDAFLDMLADRADEWEKTAEVRNALGDVRRDFDVDWLIAVLRGDTE